MAELWVVRGAELPPPAAGYDLTIWETADLPSETQMRTWAGWAETHLLAGNPASVLTGFEPRPDLWPGTDFALGGGKIWRFNHRFVAWLTPALYQIPEVPRALALAGVELMIGSRSTSVGDPALDPLWRAAQANQVFGLALGAEPVLYLPCEIDPAQEGSMPLAAEPGGWRATLRFEELADARRLLPVLPGLRMSFYRENGWWHS